jgi:hypothetical protein
MQESLMEFEEGPKGKDWKAKTGLKSQNGVAGGN